MAEDLIFDWKGTDRAGKKVAGETKGRNVTLVKAQLRKQGINAGSVKKRSKPMFSLGGKKIGPADIALFTRQLATMMKAGVPLVQSFDIVAGGVDNPAMKKLIKNISNEVSGGNSFAAAVSAQPKEYFDDLFCNLIAAGEQSGSLETMLDRLATYKEKSEALKAKIKSAMNYPISVLVIAGIVTVILLIKVIPQFESMFSSFGGELPAFTQMVVQASEFMQAWWVVIMIGIGITYAGYKQIHKTSQAFRDGQERLTLKMPVIGGQLSISPVSRGLPEPYPQPLQPAYRWLTHWTRHPGPRAMWSIRTRSLKIKSEVSGGTQLNHAMRQANVFPSMVVQMVIDRRRIWCTGRHAR